jgi:MoxR-like ATPase
LNLSALLEKLHDQLSKVILGKPKQLRLALTCIIARGHLLIEDVPGVGKTTLADSLARLFNLSFARIQFTADMLPSDILGTSVFVQNQARFEFRPGPIFHHMVLADELNRAPPRTQSALLEAMAQSQVSIDGTTHPLPQHFRVIATQNPVDLSGTFPLPDSQLDRFLMRISLGHLSPDIEKQLLQSNASSSEVIQPIAQLADFSALQKGADNVTLTDELADYAVRLAAGTRGHSEINRGVSTRAVLALTAAARAHALWEGRTFVTPLDLKSLVVPCWAHRVILRNANLASSSRDEAAQLLEDIGKRVVAPR